MRNSSIFSTLAILAAVAVAGCGGPSDAEQASTTASEYFKSLGTANASTTCSLLTAAGKKQLATDANEFDGAYGCVEAARIASEAYAAGLTQAGRTHLEGTNGKAALSGTTAEVTFAKAGSLPEQRVSLVKSGDTWKINKVATEGASDSSRATPDVLAGRSPNVAGEWRVIYSGDTDANEPSRTTWTISSCKSGACGFKAKSSYKKSKFAFRYDRAVGDFTYNRREAGDCVNTDTNEVLVKDAYKYLDRWNLKPTTAVLSEAKLIATELEGTREFTSQLSSGGESEGCQDNSDEDTFETVRFVRVNPPKGKELTLPGGLEGEQGE